MLYENFLCGGDDLGECCRACDTVGDTDKGEFGAGKRGVLKVSEEIFVRVFGCGDVCFWIVVCVNGGGWV